MKRKSLLSVFLILLSYLLVLFPTSCGNENASSETDSESSSYPAYEVSFSSESGAYPEDAFDLTLSAPEGYQIYYTTDGSVPDQKAKKYKKPIRIKGSGNNWLTKKNADLLYFKEFTSLNPTPEIRDAWIIRAAAFSPDGTAGPVTTKTYLMGSQFGDLYGKTAVISIVTAPENLLDYKTGIMVKGKSYDEQIRLEESKALIANKEYYHYPANYQEHGRDWEREASFELFDGSETLTLNADFGLRIHGGMSRAFPHRSLRLCFREEYGCSALEYPLFEDAKNELSGETISSYSDLILRNGGNAADSLVYKDLWQQSLLADRAFMTQKGRPAVVYLNGEYWGVYCLCERYSEDYFTSHFSLDHILSVKEDELSDGDESDMILFDELNAFAGRDLSKSENWDAFQQVMDIQSMADYFAVQVYIANVDFAPDKNIQLWRSTETSPDNPYADGKWRYMLYDTEYAAGMYGDMNTSATYNSLEDILKLHPLFASAMRNKEFQDLFFNALKDYGTKVFSEEKVNQSLAGYDRIFSPLLATQQMRFGGSDERKESELLNAKNFYTARYDFLKSAGIITDR